MSATITPAPLNVQMVAMFGSNVAEPTDASYSTVPEALKKQPNWVLYRLEKSSKGKLTKTPYQFNGWKAKANDASTWTTFDKVCDADKIGFELGGTDFCGLDFDGCIRADRSIEPIVLAIINLLPPETYVEYSPSGTGLHGWVMYSGTLPKGKRKMSGGDHSGPEIYHGHEGGRYFTVSGRRFSGSDVPVITEEQMNLVYFLLRKWADKDEHFMRLWLGDGSGCGDGRSDADFALCCELAKAFNSDAQKMEAAFLQSKLHLRDPAKHPDTRPDYIPRTIAAAIERMQTPTSAPDYTKTGEAASGKQLNFRLPAVKNPSDYDFVLAPLEGMIEGWFPCGSVSLFGASSGGTKSTITFQLLVAQTNGVPFLGHQTCGRPFFVIGVDRGGAAHRRTLKRMHLTEEMIPFERVSSRLLNDAAVQAVIDLVEKRIEMLPAPYQGGLVVFLEGIDMLVTKASDPTIVGDFMHDLLTVAERYHLAIIGSGGSPKQKEGSAYTNLRDKFFGSEKWGRIADTVVNADFCAKDKNRRRLRIETRNTPSEEFLLEFQDGRLIEIPNAPEEPAQVNLRSKHDRDASDIAWYQEQARLARTNPTKKYWTAEDFLAGREPKLSEATAYRRVDHARAHGWIIEKTGPRKPKTARLYCWNAADTNPLWNPNENENENEF